jgi:hypothetical protein
MPQQINSAPADVEGAQNAEKYYPYRTFDVRDDECL